MLSAWSRLMKKPSWLKSSNSMVSGENSNRSDSGYEASRLSSMLHRLTGESSLYKKTCPICLDNLKISEAIFIAECSHSFHFTCIANSVNHGNHSCPVCRFKWKELPCQLPSPTLDAGQAIVTRDLFSFDNIPFELYHPYQLQPYVESVLFCDDEPLDDSTPPTISPASNIVSVKSHTEYPAVGAQESLPGFAVLVGLRAPPLLNENRQYERGHIDLVLVLDVSSSMLCSIRLAKRAAGFVIDNLGPFDRLSIVTFCHEARRIFPLRRMTESGREDAKLAICSLDVLGGKYIATGLKKGLRVLEERRERNPTASIILLSDGNDTSHIVRTVNQGESSLHHELFTDFLNEMEQSFTIPVHTFAIGGGYNSSTMHAISNASGGSFSFIESAGMMQDAFNRSIRGYLSIVAEEFRLTVKSASAGVRICSIQSGTYASAISNPGFQGVIHIGNLYADEEKEFLVYVSVPLSMRPKRMTLLDIAYSYKDLTKTKVNLQGESVEIDRPIILSQMDQVVSLEVDRQRNKLLVAESIAEARGLADANNLVGALAVLTDCQTTLLLSASALAGDFLCSWVEAELKEIMESMDNMDMFVQAERAFALSELS